MDIFLARQAIYDTKHKVKAYELLFRNSNENRFAGDVDEDKATIKLISNCATIGLNELISNKMAFINFTQGLLLKDIPSLLSKERIVIEILESVKPTVEILDYLKKLKDDGYTIALDDVIARSTYKEFGDLIDIYKIDFFNTTRSDRQELVRNINKYNPKANLLAEKIETDEDYEEAISNGYSYFQGFYFSKPIMILGKDIPLRNISCFNIMVELLNDEFDVDKVEAIIKSDVAISYKLMKFLNSATFSFVQRISSIKQAIMLLGRKELKKWLALIVISEMQNGNDEEITNSTIIRGRFCELIQSELNPKKGSLAFMVGLFSNLDAFMQKKMDELVDELPIEEEIKRALVGEENELRNILNLVQAYEKMNIKLIEHFSKVLKIDKNILVDLYVDSIEWSNKLTV